VGPQDGAHPGAPRLANALRASGGRDRDAHAPATGGEDWDLREVAALALGVAFRGDV